MLLQLWRVRRGGGLVLSNSCCFSCCCFGLGVILAGCCLWLLLTLPGTCLCFFPEGPVGFLLKGRAELAVVN